MSVSTDGQICYGVVFEDGYEFPWDQEGLDEWWLKSVLKFKPIVQVYDEHGEYINGEYNQDKMDAYWKERKEFIAANPKPPIIDVNYCSGDYPMYILAVPSSKIINYRGYAKAFNPIKLTVSEDDIKILLEFCKTHNLTFKEGPAWYLTSYWG